MASRRDLGGLGRGIVASGRDVGGLGGILASGRNVGGLGGILASRRNVGGLGGGIVASGRNVGGLRRGIAASGRNSSGAGGSIEGFGHVHAVARFLGGTLGSNCCKAFRLALDLSFVVQQVAQIANILLLKPAEGSLKKEERGRFW